MSITALLVSFVLLGFSWWLPAEDPNRAAERLLAKGQAEAAVEHLGQAVAKDPDSPVLSYNLGNAQYRARQYDAAVRTYERAIRQAKEDALLAARAAYNTGNALYRLAESAEGDRPQEALTKYAEAMAAYRRALSFAPNDTDAKFNYEVTAQRLRDLRKRLEDQAQRTPSPSPDNGAASPSPTPTSEPSSAPSPGASSEPQSSSEQQAEAAPEEQQEPSGGEAEPTETNENGGETGNESQDSPAQGSGSTGEPVASGEPDTDQRAQALAIIDTARQEELSPSEFWRQSHRGRVAEPLQDW